MSGSNLYQRGDVWWGRVTVAGREHRRSLRTGDRREAERRFEAWRADLIAEAHFGERVQKWEDAVIEWATHAPSALKPATMTRYQTSLRMVGASLEGKRLEKITRQDVAAIVAIRRKQKATSATIKRDLTAISAVIDAAIGAGWIEDNVSREYLAGAGRMLRERRDPIALPDQADIDAVCAIAPPMIAAMARLAIETGARLEEVVTIERRQVDMRRRTLTFLRTKTGKARVIPLSDVAVAILSALPVNMGTTAVFWHGDGSGYANMSSRWAELVSRARDSAQKERRVFRPFRFHDLRHLAAVRMLRSGLSIYEVQQILGHATVKTTEIYLAHLTPEEVAAAKASRTNIGTDITVTRPYRA